MEIDCEFFKDDHIQACVDNGVLRPRHTTEM